MAKPGPRPKPNNLKLIQGLPGKRKVEPDRAVTPAIDNPDKDQAKEALKKFRAPSHLSREAKREWRRIVPRLVAMGLLSSIDIATLAAYCQAYGRWVQAEKTIAKMAEQNTATYALMLRAASGTAVTNPLVGVANKAKADMVRYAVEFGMTPSSRVRLQPGGTGTPPPTNPFDVFNR